MVQSSAGTPFRIDVPDDVLADLHDRLSRTRWPAQLDDAGWDYGTELSYLQELCAYWQNDFDWRVAEARLNSWPQFETEVDGEHLHYIHARSPHADALPLIITHGWPGSVVEFLDILGPLTDPVAHGGDAADAFHVVCPSMPGYGWSGPTHQQGWDIRRIAEANATLMAQLGYERYGAARRRLGSDRDDVARAGRSRSSDRPPREHGRGGAADRFVEPHAGAH